MKSLSDPVHKHPVLKTVLAAALALSCLSACGILKKPDMSRTAEIARLRRPQHPLIIIPGFLGSKLRDPETGKVLWGTMGNVLSHSESHRLACPIAPDGSPGEGKDLEAFAVYDSLWGVEYYRKILRILHQAGGYHLGDIQHPLPGDNAFVFVYDWRKDIVQSSKLLSESVERLKEAMGRPDLKFDLLAHSQGGLLARYYAKYGSEDVLRDGATFVPSGAGARNLNKVILLGTPNQGTLEALQILHKGVKKVFRPMPPAVTFTMPALYEMLPPPGITSFADLQGNPIDLDLYDPQTWVRNKLSIFADSQQAQLRQASGPGQEDIDSINTRYEEFLARSLRRARLFQEAIAAPGPQGQDVDYYAFGSDCIPTLKTAVLVEEKGKRKLFFEPGGRMGNSAAQRMSDILYGPGDGTVLMQSLLDLPEIYGGAPSPSPVAAVNLTSAFFVCENHGLLPNNPIFQNNLFYLLLYESDPAARVSQPVARKASVDPSSGDFTAAR